MTWPCWRSRHANDAVRLGAIKARGDVFCSRIEVLRSTGALPFDWQRWLAYHDHRRLYDRLVDVLERCPEVPGDVLEELRAETDVAPEPMIRVQ